MTKPAARLRPFECIRYQGQLSPLGDVLARYSDFFADFRGYVGGGQVDAPDVGPHRAIGGSSGPGG